MALWRVPGWRSRVALLVSLMAGEDIAEAQGTNVWVSHGPEGALVNALAIDPATPATVYVATEGGVYKTTNGGANWSLSSSGLLHGTFYMFTKALALDPATSSTVYAGGSDGVFKSTNAGANWTRTSTGLPLGYVASMAVDPTVSTTIYAGTPAAGVFKSINSGGSWTAISAVARVGFSNEIGLARLTAAGVLDGSFGSGGTRIVPLGELYPIGAAWQPDGRLIVVGDVELGPERDFAAMRLLADGTPDSSFGTGGMATTDFDLGDDEAMAALVQPNGKIVVVGDAQIGGEDGVLRFGIVRYFGGY